MAISESDARADSLVSPQEHYNEYTPLEQGLRPEDFDSYVGQDQVKHNLKVSITAAKNRGEALEHVLLQGPPGLGKTTLACIVARELGVNLKITSGPAIEKQGDLASILTNLQERDVLFIDEIHRLKMPVEEILYSAMEDYAIDIIIGKGPGARSMRLNLPRFTLVGATTKMNMLSAPLRDRFGNILRLEFYSPEHIAQIIARSAALLQCTMDPEAITTIAGCARRTPRIANRLLKRVRDFAEVEGGQHISQALAVHALEHLGIDHLGLDHTDRQLLHTIIEKFSGGPVGLNTLAAAISEEQGTVEDVYEPYLIQQGLLERTPRGRVATHLAFTHLGLPTQNAPSLFS